MYVAPYPPLVNGGAGLEQPPGAPEALRKRMAEVYGVAPEVVLPVRGVVHGVEIVLRSVAAEAVASNGVPEAPALARLLRIPVADGASAARFVASPPADGAAISAAQARELAQETGLLVVDERFIEFSDAPSLASLASASENIVVLRSLEAAYGLAGAPCGALIAAPTTLNRLAEGVEPNALPTPIVRLAEAALDPVRAPAQARRIAEIKAERRRLARALSESGHRAAEAEAPFVLIAAGGETQQRLRAFGVTVEKAGDGALRIPVRDGAGNDRVLAAFGVETQRPSRRAEAIRETAETRVVVQLDLDRPQPVEIDTGVEFYDHMLSQIAVHGGFSLTLKCAGDLGVDAHHTIEDCALALGGALSQALAARRGIARFGFVLPMDEAEGKVSVDLGGRPYLVFDGAFKAPLLGAYPTEMTEHVFRSLAQTMGAAIHLSVSGENDHHKTEACYKAFGRALRQAIRVEGDAVPSSKGVI